MWKNNWLIHMYPSKNNICCGTVDLMQKTDNILATFSPPDNLVI